MRKRAQRRSTSFEVKQVTEEIKTEKRRIIWKKNWWIAVALIGIFFLVLLLNSYFNISSGYAINPNGETLSEKYYLSGPDPYYNMRLVETTMETGRYPYYTNYDPLLNYPLGSTGGRAPLLNMMAIGFSRFLVPFMSEIDAIGYSMQFIPALFGALIVFPVYFIGKTLFGKKEGLIGALLVALIPIHIGSGHGSAYSLFDHDSFNLLLFFLTFLFLIKGIKEKDAKKSILYALLSGLPLAALTMTWVEAQFLYVVIAVYAIVQMIIDIFTNKIEIRIARTPILVLFAGYGISLPVRMVKANFGPDLALYICIGVALFGAVYFILGKKKIPWIISLPTIFGVVGIVLVFLYFIEDISSYLPFLGTLTRISNIIYGTGIYGNKVAQTIAEASTADISKTWMSYGPVLVMAAGFCFAYLIYLFLKQKGRRDYLFIIILFIINIWLIGTAGRFLNDFVPLIAILAGAVTWFVVSRINYKQMLRNIRNAGGGLRGLRRGMKAFHVLGILFVAFLVILPNAFLALDAAVPTDIKKEYFGEDYENVFGSGSGKETYWVDAFAWLNDQDQNIENPAERPAFISWWDYGFYESAVGGHPTVADNFQDGIPPAANFHTAKSEKEAVAVMIVRLLEGNLRNNDGVLSTDVVAAFEKHIGVNETANITNWIQNPMTSPSYNAPIGEQYDKNLSEIYRVGEQYTSNGFYHDIVETLNNTLDEEGITWLYHDIQNATGYSIRYYGVEGYDEIIFKIFSFLGDKSIVLYALSSRGSELSNPEDDFIKIYYAGYEVDPNTREKIRNGQWSADELNTMSTYERRNIVITSTPTEFKDDYYKTMFYRTYVGDSPYRDQAQFPCWGMNHFYAEYISPYGYRQGRSAVVIAKYYEGAYINGSISCNNTPLEFVQAVVFDKFGVPHNNTFTDANGNFSLMVPAGNVTLQFSYANEVFLKLITFNSTEDPLFSPIMEEEAMRLTNYTREINVTINLSTVEGFVYEDNNDNGSYEPDIDTPLSDVTIELTDEFFQRTIAPVVTDENGYYILTDLYPSKYTISALEDGFEIHSESISVSPGNLSYNISKPKLAAVKGKVFYDQDNNGSYDPGEEMNGVTVDILYSRDDNLVDSITTDETGDYSFYSLVPGDYILNATVENSTTGYYDYMTEEPITLEENKTITYNISINYAPITVSGYTKHGDENVGDISIEFSLDETVENNTAQRVTATSEEDGSYTAGLMPGYYNVTVYASVEQGIFYFEGKLFINIGEGVKSYDVSMTKQSVTVTGYTKYDDTNIANLTIDFLWDPNVENNTAEDAQTESDENGSYVVELMPGSYDVTVDESVNESGQDVIYTFTGKLEVKTDDVTKSFDIALERTETD